ncbi:glycosyltransferase [Jeongeupia naejangsanensis]|uniref:Glycosyltransferase n=1 Tax=Jeongeupia naejangsanensis TaxID=613195 RepID=A0ABS2BQC1_9NEIS|nr:glycosyltransferase [Jeongeupia naejangsanensis]MBM3117233.1 glycosyltransferase [Jeongeupia naejangsanensis]
MRLLFVVRDLGLGGVERCVVLVGSWLAARGFKVTVAMLGGSRNLWGARTATLEIVDLSGAWHPKKPWTWFAGWCALRGLAQRHDAVIAATFLMPLYLTWAATRGLGRRVLGWVHGPLAEVDARAHMNPLHRRACQYIYRRLPELVFVSAHARDSLARWLGHESGVVGQGVAQRWQVIPNFVEPQPARPAGPVRDPLRLLFVGRVAEEKQPALWLDALMALDRLGHAATLTVVGDGPLLPWLQEEAVRRGLQEHLIIAGRQDDIGAWLADADWLLLTSLFEGCPLVVLEAMRAGLPVVSTRAGGVYELFAEREADFVTGHASGEAIAALIVAQAPHHAEHAAWLRWRADAYSPDALGARWLHLLENTR